MKIKAFVLALLLAVSALLSGCYDSREPDELAYVIALGIDKGRTNSLKLTFQLALPKNIGGQQGGGGGGEETSTVVVVECPTIYSGINMANTFVSRQMVLSHCKAIIFSREMAEDGVEVYINAMERSREFRPNMYVLVARGSAESYIRSVKPKIEVNPSKYYELSFKSYRYTAFTANTMFYYFYNAVKSLGGSSYATLAGVSDNTDSGDLNLEGSTYREKGRSVPLEGDFKAGDITAVGNIKAEIMGTAVFREGKMVGELDGDETSYHLMTMGDFNYAYFTVPDPKSPKDYLVLNLKQSRKPSIKGELEGEKLKVKIKVFLEADILSIQSGINYEDIEKLGLIEKEAEKLVTKGMKRMLEKVRDEYNADICSFGDRFRKYFTTWKQWEEFKWLEHYKDTEFDIQVDVKVRRPGLMLYTSKIMQTPDNEEGQE